TFCSDVTRYRPHHHSFPTRRSSDLELDGALRRVIREHSGTAIEGKLLGDGVLAVFTSARQAIEAALACARSGGDAGLPLHLGLRSEEHTSELQSRGHLVCRLRLEKK